MGFSHDTGNISADVDNVVEAYASLVTALNLEKPDVMGWSYGGVLSLLLVCL